MTIRENVSLAQHSTMRLGGTSRYYAEIESLQDLREALDFARKHDIPVLVIGDGSNIVWRDEGYDGLVLVNRLAGFTAEPVEGGSQLYEVTLGAGESWDACVARTVELGLTGIEGLSLVPGTAGATPVQNVGAYGQDISQTLVSVLAFDMQSGQTVTIPAADCAFSYRNSRFKTTDRGRFCILSVTLQLRRGNPWPPFYAAAQKYFDEHHWYDITPALLRQAVVAIRQAKLPDPALVANNGSFFANPIISQAQFQRLAERDPDMPHWPTADPARIKIPAAWLIEQAGFKDYHDAETGMATWPVQPLVLVNEHATSTGQLLAFRHKIVSAVADKFGITLEQEPELLPIAE